ncbi:Transmembrane emp24 domain-containing protein 5 [Amphibalanus amphitrite]|uniref:Transmembrane emp24 domain-containing protein 5 n=1 Tax=Amphibalanus amphitrite TaxID=1232801 RepID=A0A6A4WJP9_AMPAM|nr:Transmembrane emp24 domain-containing protein 5 [Amphibalanus amphitrite]
MSHILFIFTFHWCQFQVIDGGQGDIDINFHLHSPTGRQIVSDYKKSDNAHRRAAEEEGDYKACWDNSISRFNNKLVFFEVGVEREDGGEVWDSIEHEFGTEGEVYDIKLQDIQVSHGPYGGGRRKGGWVKTARGWCRESKEVLFLVIVLAECVL